MTTHWKDHNDAYIKYDIRLMKKNISQLQVKRDALNKAFHESAGDDYLLGRILEINKHKYRMACEEGQEIHLEGLASLLDERIAKFKASFGEIGNARLVIMAAISTMDELQETKKELSAIKLTIDAANAERDKTIAAAKALERECVARMADTVKQVDLITDVIEETGARVAHADQQPPDNS